MLSLGSLALLAISAVTAAPTSSKVERSTDVKVSDKVLTLKQVGVKPGSSRALLGSLAVGTEALSPAESGAGYSIEVGLGGASYDVIFDTGSSDLWVFEDGVKCIGPKGKVRPASYCAFGPEFGGSFQGGAIPDKNFLVSYGSGEQLAGILGYEDVTVAGVTVDNQEMALVDEAIWIGDGVVSGIVGFAYSSLTSQYPGNNPAKDEPSNDEPFKNFLTHAISQGKIDPLFTVVLERGGGSSSLTLGGVPSSVSGLSYATTPIEKVEISPLLIEKTEYSYYTIYPDGLKLDGESASTTFAAIVDTGTTLLYLPSEYADAVNAAYDPPSVFNKAEGVYENLCNAKAPTFGVTIGGETFMISASELVLHGVLGKDTSTGLCVTGVQSSATVYAILGDVFLKNVVAVFDVGASKMKFAAHENY